MGRANAQDTQHWKRPWGLCGVGLRLKEQKGPSLKRAGDLTWEPSRLPGLEWVGQMPSSPLLLLRSGVWEGPSRLPLLISPASLLCPQDQCGLGRGALDGRGPAWKLSRLLVVFLFFCFEQPRTAFINPHFQHRFILNFEMCLFYMNMGMRKR